MKTQSVMFGCSILLMGLAGTCLAGGVQPSATPSSVSEIVGTQRELRTKLDAPGSQYSRFDLATVRKVEAAQDRIFRILDGKTSVDQLNEQQKLDLANALEQVKSTLLANEDSRLICHIERKTGTNLTSRRCETVGSRNKNLQESRIFLADHPHHYYGNN